MAGIFQLIEPGAAPAFVGLMDGHHQSSVKGLEQHSVAAIVREQWFGKGSVPHNRTFCG